MTNLGQHRAWISGMRLRAASAALAFVVVLGLEVVTTQSAQAQTFTVLHNFTGSPDGAYPFAGVIRDTAGNLYGTTEGGGKAAGTVFKVSKTSKETVLHSFTESPDGGAPFGGLVRDAAGNLYGTTAQGGSSSNFGTVFKVSTTGKETVLHSFKGGTKDGEYPEADVLRDAAGNLYGTTSKGGSSGYGTVFKVSTTGKETVVHSFTGGANGAYPYAGVIMDTKGNLYGTTSEIGSSGYGTVFKVSTTGKETVLHNFTGGAHGAYPYAGVIMDAKGNLYGTTVGGGAQGLGTVFKLSTTGKLTTLYSFCSRSGCADGGEPYAGLVRDAAGNLYGTTTLGGGSSSSGGVYEFSSSGKLTVLHSFAGSDGESPRAGVVRDTAGNLYGTTEGGGSSGGGTVWKLTP